MREEAKEKEEEATTIYTYAKKNARDERAEKSKTSGALNNRNNM